VADLIPGTSASPPAPPPVAGNGQPKPAPTPPSGTSAKTLAPQHGGLRGGRGRCDGLIPGSPEAKEADRKKDAERKRKRRAPEPPPLPGAGAAGIPPQAAPDGMGGVPGSEGPPPVPWEPDLLKPIFDQLIPAAEQGLILQLASKAEKARLPGDLVRDIQQDAAWPAVAKKGLEMSAPRVAAKVLNATGISSQHQDFVVLLSSLTMIGGKHLQLLRRMDKIIAQQTAAAAKPPAEEKKP
jgi:hypothetical protein